MFGLSRQVYYRRIRATNRRKTLAQEVIDLIVPIRRRMPRIGTRKLYFLLKPKLELLGIGRDKLFAIMKANHLEVKPERSYRVTTFSHHRFRKHKDLVNGLFITRPEQVWVSDITYMQSGVGHHYLALVTDAYSKKIVGYDLSNSLQTEGVLRAMKMAIKTRKYQQSTLIHHSDRGLQYCSNEYQRLLSNHKITCSMTTDSDPYSNAIAERVNGIIKNEFCIEKYKVDLITQQKIVSETIAIYNDERPHYSCSYLTPNQMHCQSKLPIKTYKNKKGSRNVPATFEKTTFIL